MSNARNIADITNGDDAPIYALRGYALFGETSSSTSGTAPHALKTENIDSFTWQAQGKIRITFTENMPSTDYLLLTGGVDVEGGGYNRDVMVRDRQLGYVDVTMFYVNATSSSYYGYEFSVAILY